MMSPWLEKELDTLGFPPERVDRMAVWVSGSLEDCMELNLKLRTANRVLYLLNECQAHDADALYKKVCAMPWETVLPPDGYFSIHGYVKNDTIRDDRFAYMKVKDAIADRMMAKCNRRPDSGSETNRSVIYLHWFKDKAAIYLDTSGESIAKHGYRKIPGKAPMNEALASAVIMATEWDSKVPFINPMCGSGTLAIEAALMASGKYPGNFRENYGFMHCLMYKAENFEKLKSSIKNSSNAPPKIIATDHDPVMIEAARKNARAAGVEELITFQKCDYSETPVPEGPGVVILNPEYGQRLGDANSLEETYRGIGDFFKQHAQGKKAYIFTGNPDLGKKVGLRTSSKTPFMNARIECRLLAYEIYAGTRRN